MKILPATRQDLPAILDLQYLAYQSEARQLNNYEIPPLKQTLAQVEEEFAKGLFLKAVSGEGSLVGSVRGWVEEGTLYIGKLMVHPSMQGQGIGSRLLTALEEEYPQARKELFTSHLSEKNLKLYKKLGYVEFKTAELSPSLKIVYLEKMGA